MIRIRICLTVAFLTVGTAIAAPKGPVDAPKADDKAAKALDEAIAKLDREKAQWIEAQFRMQTDFQGLTFQAKGTYQAGPNFRLNLDLQVLAGKVAGTMQVVSNGTTCYEVLKMGDGKPQAIKYDVQRYIGALQNPILAEHISDFFPFGGPATILNVLKKKLVATNIETFKQDGKDLQRITFAYPEDTVKKVKQEAKRWPLHVARQCEVTIDTATGCPVRIDWFGKVPGTPGESLLTSIEILDPKFNEEIQAARFEYKGDTKDVKDVTDERIKQIDERAKQLQKN